MRGLITNLVVVAAIFSGWMIAVPAAAQSDDEKSRAAETLENGKLEAARYAVFSAPKAGKPFELKPESLLKWQNTVNKSVHGNIFGLTNKGRPELVASIMRFYSPRTSFGVEFQSLALTPLTIEKEGEVVWTPKEPGVVLKPFDEEMVPSDSKPQRLRQMRQLAQSFTADLEDYDRDKYKLRLMPQPLYRYESTDPEVLDGALFSYTYTTDPDLLVVIEARQSNGRFRWMFGLARMNVGEVKVTYNNREVFHAQRLETYSHPTGIYTIIQGLPVPTSQETSK